MAVGGWGQGKGMGERECGGKLCVCARKRYVGEGGRKAGLSSASPSGGPDALRIPSAYLPSGRSINNTVNGKLSGVCPRGNPRGTRLNPGNRRDFILRT